jgi:hypothetical protein
MIFVLIFDLSRSASSSDFDLRLNKCLQEQLRRRSKHAVFNEIFHNIVPVLGFLSFHVIVDTELMA